MEDEVANRSSRMSSLSMVKDIKPKRKRTILSFSELSTKKLQKEVVEKLENGEDIFVITLDKILFKLTLAEF